MLEGKKIIVTGGAYGIGASLVAALAKAGAQVAAMARTADLGEQVAAQATAAGRDSGRGKATFHRCDVSDRAQVKAAFAAAAAEMGGLDGLVHVAGVETGCAPEDETDETWDHMMNINAKGTFITNQEAFPYLKSAGNGRILNFASGAGVTGSPRVPVYATSKGAVISWSRSCASAWGRHGITVNIVNPTVVTQMYREYRARQTPEVLRQHDADMAFRMPIDGKMGDTDRDLVPVVLFMLSDGSRYLTGQLLNVDGGLIMAR